MSIVARRGWGGGLIGVYASLALFWGCSTLVGVEDFSPGRDGGSADGTVVQESGQDSTTRDGSGSSSGADTSSSSGTDSGSESSSGVDAHADAKTPDSGAGCVIGGTTYTGGAANPTNACQSCQASVSASVWTDVTDGTTCGSGGICHTGACVSGCEIGDVYYTTGAPNPNSGCQTCQPATSTSAWSDLADGTGCGNGQVCASGKCGTQCDIGGTVYASGAPNPSNACQSCQPGTSTTAWSNVANGTSCASGEVCSAGSCASDCFIGGTVYTSGTANPSNACQSCQPGASTTAWSNVANGTSCGSAEVCNAGSCASDCFIGGAIDTSGAANPTNACQTCQPGTSTTAWTDVANGVSCATGVCNAGSCASDCFIGGTIYTSGAANPTNACQSCQPGTSTTAWTVNASANGTTCATGEVCNAGSCVSDCYIGSVLYVAGTANPTNACQNCQPGTSTLVWTNAANGTSCVGPGTCSSGSCVTTPSCAAGGAGMNTCPGGTGSESCCTSLEVIGGTFSRTYTNPGDGGIDEQDPASVTGFRLDKYEVTVGRFRQFANAVLPPDGGTGWLPPAASGKHTHLNGGQGLANSGSPGNYESGWVTSDNAQVTLLGCVGNAYATWTPSAGSNENLPINCVNSYEAYAFCIWDGGFLPSEAEWEYAAAGGSLELEFPWGSADPGTTSQYAIYGCDYNGSGTCTGVANIAPVGTTTLGAGVWGQLDLAGNLMEWDLDWYAAYTTCTDCAYLETGTNRMVRGGAYPYPSSYFPLRNYTTAATYRGSDVGFRCARIP